jgi:hypothetical protein
LEEAGRGRLKIEEDTGNDERHDDVGDERTDGDAGISYQASPTTPETKLSLLQE